VILCPFPSKLAPRAEAEANPILLDVLGPAA